jgi:5'-deoxynucleotidase YfbR-like HD superfamily hydrolase
MIVRVIVSEREKAYFDVEAVIIGDDEAKVLAETNKKFRELIKADNEEVEIPLNDDQIEECVNEGRYMDDEDDTGCEMIVFTPTQLIEANSEKEFENATVQDI